VKSDSGEQTKSQDLDYTVRLFRPEDADGVVDLFRAVHGDTYPIKIFYDAPKLTEANKTGEYVCVVARTGDGRVIGVHNLYRSAPYHSMYEWGAGLVHQDYRGHGVSGRLEHQVVSSIIPQLGVEVVFGESVCYHVHMQKFMVAYGYVETALEVALMPAQIYFGQGTTAGRVATITSFRSYRPRPHAVYVPRRYQDACKLLYDALDDSRELVPSRASTPAGIESQSELQLFDFAQLARIAIRHPGNDLDGHLADLESRVLAQGTLVIQVWLNLTCPWVGEAVEILTKRGYFLGGILPRWFNDDGFLMQKLACEPYFEEITLYSDRAHKILDLVQRDWRCAAGYGT
jgi:hypothetical protein